MHGLRGLTASQMSSVFECNTSAGFAWITLNASLATMSNASSSGAGSGEEVGGEPLASRAARLPGCWARNKLVQKTLALAPALLGVAGPGVALMSHCQAIGNSTDPAGCCTQVRDGVLATVDGGRCQCGGRGYKQQHTERARLPHAAARPL